jgi:hypothetical protein
VTCRPSRGVDEQHPARQCPAEQKEEMAPLERRRRQVDHEDIALLTNASAFGRCKSGTSQPSLSSSFGRRAARRSGPSSQQKRRTPSLATTVAPLARNRTPRTSSSVKLVLRPVLQSECHGHGRDECSHLIEPNAHSPTGLHQAALTPRTQRRERQQIGNSLRRLFPGFWA